MNQTQVKYARERVEAIFKKREAVLKKAFTTPARRLSSAEKSAALAAGAFTLKPVPAKTTDYLSDYVDFGETYEVLNTDAMQPLLDALKIEKQELVDSLVLGSAEDALAAIRVFEERVDVLAS